MIRVLVLAVDGFSAQKLEVKNHCDTNLESFVAPIKVSKGWELACDPR